MSEALVILYVLGAWTILITIVAVVLRLRRGRPTSEDVALEDLDARWARGELSADEYRRRRRAIRGTGGERR